MLGKKAKYAQRSSAAAMPPARRRREPPRDRRDSIARVSWRQQIAPGPAIATFFSIPQATRRRPLAFARFLP
jgi:hypothetical protein